MEKGKRKEWQVAQSTLPQKKNVIRLQSPALLCDALKTVFGPSDLLLSLDTNHYRQQPMFCQVFPGRIMGQNMLPLDLCEFLLSSSSLSSCGHRTKLWAFRHSVGSRCAVPCSHHALAATPVPLLSPPSALLGLAAIPPAQPAPVLPA